jgi:DNA-binding CsgD family transcriptional regulator
MFTKIRSSMSKKDPVILSPREAEVLLLVIKGLSSKKIGEQLYLSKRTTDGYRRDLLMKTRCRNTAQLAIWAYENGYKK